MAVTSTAIALCACTDSHKGTCLCINEGPFYPQHLEKFANAAVKDVFVHDRAWHGLTRDAGRALGASKGGAQPSAILMTRPPHAQAAAPDYATLLREALR